VLICNPSSHTDLTSVAHIFGTLALVAVIYTAVWYLRGLYVACS